MIHINLCYKLIGTFSKHLVSLGLKFHKREKKRTIPNKQKSHTKTIFLYVYSPNVPTSPYTLNFKLKK